MIALLSFLKSLFSFRRASLEEEYLADSTDLIDLERRMQALERRQRPVFGY